MFDNLVQRLSRQRMNAPVVAGIALCCSVLLIAFWAIIPVINAITLVQQQTSIAQRMLSIAAQKPAYGKLIDRARQELNSQNAFYQAPTAELAAAQMQGVLQSLAAQYGGQVRSSFIEAPNADRGLQELGISLTVSVPADHLGPFLAAIATQRPWLEVKNLDLRANEFGGQSGMLDAQMLVNAYREAP